LPDAYGVYAETNHGRVKLRGQATALRGNLMSPVPGIVGSSGVDCSAVKDFIVYEKDIQPGAVGLVRLEYMREATLPGILGNTRASVNLWVPKERIELDVGPIEERRDMYILTPHVQLAHGLYALYAGSFSGEPGLGGSVYDIAVGAASDFPSQQAVAADREAEARKNAPALLATMNGLLDRKEHGELANVYRPEGRVLAGPGSTGLHCREPDLAQQRGQDTQVRGHAGFGVGQRRYRALLGQEHL
jgi:hypothetical protein